MSKTFETHNGKEIQFYRNPQALFQIRFGGGGELPQELQGLFTSERFAEAAVYSYLEKTKGRKKSDGENPS